MRARRTAWRRLAAALAGAALLAIGAPLLHQHVGAADGSERSIAAQAPLASAAHAQADCPACQSGGRTRVGLAPAVLVVRTQPLPALRFAAPGAPAAPSAASRPPTPPRGPPVPTV